MTISLLGVVLAVGFKMRGIGVLCAALLAMSIGIGCGEVLANTKGALASTAAPARDLPQLQSAMVEWLRLTATSSQFIFGTVLGLVCAEIGHLVWRLVWKLSRVVALLVEFVLRYGLFTACVGAALYYGSVYWAFV